MYYRRVPPVILAVLAGLFWSPPASAAIIFQESFNGYASGNLVGQGPWTERATGTAIGVSAEAVVLGPNGQDAVAPITPAISFDPVTNPAVANGFTFYEGADVTVSTARTGDYFMHTSGSPTSSSFQGRIYVRSAGSGFVLGTAVTSEPPVYGTTELNLNQVYRVVLRYDVVPGASNDRVGIYVDPAITEPAEFYASTVQSTAGDASGLGAFNLRQGASASGPNLTIDHLVAADDYLSAAAVPEPGALLLAAGLAAALGCGRKCRPSRLPRHTWQEWRHTWQES
jgi:hypothetical protein